ncbi:MAG: tagaturonate epimerase family protein [Clostridiaceae bacterium]
MFNELINDIKNENIKSEYGPIKVYERSFSTSGKTKVVLIKIDSQKFLVAVGIDELYNEIQGVENIGFKLAFPTHENRLVLNKFFPYTAPVANVEHRTSVGLGDRLGLATPGHIETLRDTDVFPIFAQQSVRELDMTGRTYEDVIDTAAYAVFQEGYKKGYGADGDHLKTKEDIIKELAIGATMITLDSSEKIDNTIITLSKDEVVSQYNALDERIRSYYEGKYLDKNVGIDGLQLTIDKEALMNDVLIYHAAIDFIEEVYQEIIVRNEKPIDFEISIDETSTPTTATSHFIIANELKDRNITISTMAPRFIGEFQKGIDYIGGLDEFRKDFRNHVAIANHFGYRISVHSGSDKFSIFPIVAEETKGKFHIKTAGTNWLEAVTVIAETQPDLYREIHQYALKKFDAATKFYHVSTNLGNVPDLSTVSDQDLPSYMKNNDGRQLLHITYGYILQDKDENGNFILRDKFFNALEEHSTEYRNHLVNHIGNHLKLLKLK